MIITVAEAANLVPGMTVRQVISPEETASFKALWGDLLDATPEAMTITHIVKHASGDGWTIYGQGGIGYIMAKAGTLIEVI